MTAGAGIAIGAPSTTAAAELTKVTTIPVEGDDPEEQAWEAVLIVEGIRSGDGREIESDGLEWRTLPLPLMWQYEEPDFGGHAKSKIVGSIREIWREGADIRARGVWDTSEDASECARLVDEQMVRWVSADLELFEVEYIEEGDCSEEGWMNGECEIFMKVVSGNVMGATIVNFPAFPQAVIVPAGADIGEATDKGRDAAEVLAASGKIRKPRVVLASVPNPPAEPPAAWFEPSTDGLTAFTITDEGRVFGHAAPWDTCHIGHDGVCLTAPSSPSDYAYFSTGATIVSGCETCNEHPTGVITMDTGHAPMTAAHRAAAAHYDDTGTQVADIAVGEDEFGIWVAGALRPGVTAEQVRKLRASALSGDWRRIGGSLELVALLAVNVPGFPIPRARVASGHQQSLVAAGVRELVKAVDPAIGRIAALEARVASVERIAGRLRGAAAAQIVASV